MTDQKEEVASEYSNMILEEFSSPSMTHYDETNELYQELKLIEEEEEPEEGEKVLQRIRNALKQKEAQLEMAARLGMNLTQQNEELEKKLMLYEDLEKSMNYQIWEFHKEKVVFQERLIQLDNLELKVQRLEESFYHEQQAHLDKQRQFESLLHEQIQQMDQLAECSEKVEHLASFQSQVKTKWIPAMAQIQEQLLQMKLFENQLTQVQSQGQIQQTLMERKFHEIFKQLAGILNEFKQVSRSLDELKMKVSQQEGHVDQQIEDLTQHQTMMSYHLEEIHEKWLNLEHLVLDRVRDPSSFDQDEQRAGPLGYADLPELTEFAQSPASFYFTPKASVDRKKPVRNTGSLLKAKPLIKSDELKQADLTCDSFSTPRAQVKSFSLNPVSPSQGPRRLPPAQSEQEQTSPARRRGSSLLRSPPFHPILTGFSSFNLSKLTPWFQKQEDQPEKLILKSPLKGMKSLVDPDADDIGLPSSLASLSPQVSVTSSISSTSSSSSSAPSRTSLDSSGSGTILHSYTLI